MAREPAEVVHGIEVPRLPPSVVIAGGDDRGASAIRPAVGSILAEKTIEMPWVVHGHQMVNVEVER